MFKKRFLVLCLIALVHFSCGNDTTVDSSNDPPETLAVDGKDDIAAGITRLGELSFGGEIDGEFEKDFDVHAYTISAKRGADLRLEVTNKGTSKSLDTNLFLYAPTDDGLVRIAKDDDSGFGSLSRIDIVLRKDAEFLVVIKDQVDDARGKYRLSLECNSDDCAFDSVPDISSECPDRLVDSVIDCVAETHRSNGGFPDFEQLLDGCAEDEDQALVFHEEMCFAGDDEWCFEDFDTFFVAQMMPNCRTEASATFALDLPVDLEHTTDFSPFAMTFEGCDNCTININSLRYDGTPNAADVGESAIAFTSWPIGVSVEESEIVEVLTDMTDALNSQYDAELGDEIEPHLQEISAAVGDIESASRIAGFGVTGEEFIQAWALNIPSENRVVLFEVVDESF